VTTLLDLIVPASQAHSTASVAAAKSMRGKTASIRERVRLALLERPMTDEELIVEVGGSPSTIRPRRIELMHAGVVVEVGHKTTSSGRLATIWGVDPCQ
jgi:hypothetical protein